MFSQIITSGKVEMGWLQESNSINDSYYVNQVIYKSAGYSDIRLLFCLKKIKLDQQVFTIFGEQQDDLTFKAFEIKYSTRIYYDFGQIKVGGEHMCLHPIINNHNQLEQSTRRVSFNKLFIQLSFGNN